MKNLFKSKIARTATLAFALLVYVNKEWINENVFNKIPVKYLAIFSLVCIGLIAFLFIYERVSPIIRLFRVAKFRGFYEPDHVDNIIYASTLKANKVKMKITRAHSLFVKRENQSFKKVLDEVRNNKKYSNKELAFQILLHTPCQISEHVINRAKANDKKNNMTEFIHTWFETIRELDNYNNNNNNKLNFEIKFYSEKHTKWRFFIFETLTKMNDTMLFDYYDSSSPSYREDMYRVGFHEHSLLKDFESYFDHMWLDNRESIDALAYLKDDFAKTNNVLTACSSCAKKSNCEKILKQYPEFA